MVRKKLASAILAISALQAGLVNALGLGEITLNSTLNQPLDAQIRLFDVGNLDASQVIVRLASAEDFRRAGVDRDFFLTNLRFEVELDDRGVGRVRVTSRDAVVEPFLNFMLEARWPSGRLLREYTVLLDPPTLGERGVQPVAPAAATSAMRRAAEEASTPPVAPVRERPTAPPPARTGLPEATGEREYRVQHNDTLWQIASRFRPDAGASVEQTMLAIQRLNPEAFMRGNINLVKSGYVLRLPTSEEVRQIGGAEAREEVAAHNRAWRSGERVATAEVSGPRLDARAPGERAPAPAPVADRLSIAAGAGGADAGSAAAGADGVALSALREELASNQELLDESRRESEELRSRLSDMERQMATLQRLVSLKDEQLAALQDSVGREPAVVEERDAVDFNYDDAAPAVAPSPPASAPVQPPPPTPDPGGFNPLYLAAGAAVALLLLLGGLLARRRKAAAEEVASTSSGEALEPLESFDIDDDALISDEPDTGDQTAPASGAAAGMAAAAAGAVGAVAGEAPATPVRAETGDAIAEADIYIAYGRHQQAADLLGTAIANEPERSDLRAKLAELYVDSGDKAGFLAAWAGLQTLGDRGAEAQVKEYMSSVDGVSDWLDDVPASTAMDVADIPVESAADDADSISFDDGETAGGDESRLGGDDLILDLDLDADTEDDGFGGDLSDVGDGLDFDSPALTGPGDVEAATEEEEALPTLDELPGITPTTGAGLQSDTDGDDFGALDFELDLDDETPAAGATGAVPGISQEAESGAGIDWSGSDATAQPGGSELDIDLGDDSEFDLALEGMAGLDDLDLDLGELDDDAAAQGGAPQLAASESPEGHEGEFEGLFGESLGDELGVELEGDLDGEPDAEFASGQAVDLDGGLDSTFETLLPEDSGAGAESVAGAAAEAVSDTATDPVQADDVTAGFGDDDFELPEDLTFDESDALAATDAPLAGTAGDMAAPAGESGDEDGDEYAFLSDDDEIATKLDLARAYIDMGDGDGAREILEEVMQEGSPEQREEASALLQRAS